MLYIMFYRRRFKHERSDFFKWPLKVDVMEKNQSIVGLSHEWFAIEEIVS